MSKISEKKKYWKKKTTYLQTTQLVMAWMPSFFLQRQQAFLSQFFPSRNISLFLLTSC